MANIKKLRDERGFTQSEVAAYLGVSPQAYGNYELGKREMSADVLKKLARYFGVSTDALLDIEPPEGLFLPVERSIAVEIIASVRAGYGGLAETDSDGFAPAYGIKDAAQYRFFRVKGDSMAPDILEGDLALVHIQNDIESGQLAVVLINGDEGTLKKVKKHSDCIELISFNEDYPPRFLKAGEFTIWGRVVETIRRL